MLLAWALLPLAVGCRSAPRADPRLLRAEASTRAEAWNDAVSLWSDIYRDSRGTDRRAGIESVRALSAAGRPGVARSRLLQMESRWPEDAEILELLGRAHEQIGDEAAALDAYSRALRIEPDRPSSLARHGLLAAELVGADPMSESGTNSFGPEGSLARLRAAGTLRDVDARSLFELGLHGAAAARFDEAFEALAIAIGTGELSAAERLEAAAALAPDPRTIPWLTAVVREDPLHTRALTLLGKAQLSAGFQARAVDTLEQAAQSDPGDEAALRAFAEALTATGQAGRAREILDLLD
ncbi:hypothetical protein Poly30_53800 [Planctomycetes bacterium Poly30]|uniref:Tetratricopeptide repeat protein n=1 Tax=Saltatorellus ferox TaxID=2528018 RepID=A0A518F0F6_9BACT|nr:hypothetical protein Poly30_53800 [Planctomycetes bacterium Poly30]